MLGRANVFDVIVTGRQSETNCRNEKQRSGSKKTTRVCDYTIEKVWQSCGSPECSLQTGEWKRPDPRQNENWGVDPTNPLAGAEARGEFQSVRAV